MRNHKKHETNPFESGDGEISRDVLDIISELSKTGMSMYRYISFYSFKKNGIVYIDREEIKFELNFKGNKSIYNGLNELLTKEILANCEETDQFYYNPKFVNLL